MVKSSFLVIAIMVICMGMFSCTTGLKESSKQFDQIHKTLDINNWQLTLKVINQNNLIKDTVGLEHQYLKASLDIYNTNTQKSLLYSVADDKDDYEVKFTYLSFSSKDDLYIKFEDEYIYPIGYVFEPSNGLSKSDRLVYKFKINDERYQKMLKKSEDVEYWYIERIAELGKICFTQNI